MAESETASTHAVLPLSAGPEVVTAARSFVRRCLAGWQLQPDLSSDATLLVSELVTNALRHGPPPVFLDVSLHHDRVRISVADSSPAHPRAVSLGTWAESGRGLALLDGMAAAWGIEISPPGKWVWCELRRPTIPPDPGNLAGLA